MSRPWRIQYPDAVYHITARGNNRQRIFVDDRDRYAFLDLLAEAAMRYHLQIFAFCLMDNHYHLLLRTPEANLAAAMHWLNVSFTVRFNRRHRRSGHLFQGRYKSVLVLKDEHWLHLSMYIHLNPVRGGIVEDPAEFVWSSFRDYTRRKPRFDWLMREEILVHYGTAAESRPRSYRRECLALAGTRPAFLEQLKSGAVLGTREALERIVKKYRPEGDAKEVPDYGVSARAVVDVEKELKKVAKACGVKTADLYQRKRNFLARYAAYYHLLEHCGMGNKRTAEIFGVTTSAVSKGCQRLKGKMEHDKNVLKLINQLSPKSRPDPNDKSCE